MKRYYIYKAIDDYDEILYVGLTTNINRRMREHKKSSKWWTKSKYIYVANAFNKTTMLLYEQYYINKYNPPYNIKDKRNDKVIHLDGIKELFFNYEYKNNITLHYNIEDSLKSLNILKKEANNLKFEIEKIASTNYCIVKSIDWYFKTKINLKLKYEEKYNINIYEDYDRFCKIFDRINKKYEVNDYLVLGFIPALLKIFDLKFDSYRINFINVTSEDKFVFEDKDYYITRLIILLSRNFSEKTEFYFHMLEINNMVKYLDDMLDIVFNEVLKINYSSKIGNSQH